MNIVLVVYDFRDKALAGSFRIQNFAKHLAELGHKVTVICAFSDDVNSLLSAFHMKVIADKDRSSFSCIPRIYSRMINWPDPSASWARRVIDHPLFKEAVSDSGAVLVSSPPHGIQSIGVAAALGENTKYFADLRDDFLGNHRIKWRTPFHYLAAARLEKALVRSAHKVILNTEEVARRFVARYPLHCDKFVVLTNGYSDELQPLSRSEEATHCTRQSFSELVYIGSPYDGYAAKLILEIHRELCTRGKGSEWRFRTAGPGDWKALEGCGVWHHEGLVSQERANALMRSAGTLLLLMPPGEQEPSGTVPLKTYSYLASNRPIIYYGESGSTTELLKLFEGTVSVGRSEVSLLVDALLEMSGLQPREQINRKPDILDFHFSAIVKKLELVLKN